MSPRLEFDASIPRITHVRSPFSPLHLLLFVLVLGFLAAFIQVGLLTIVFDKLGLSGGSALLLLFASLFGSGINLPLFSVRADPPAPGAVPDPLRGLLRLPQRPFAGHTLIAVNVGGCLIPVTFSAPSTSPNLNRNIEIGVIVAKSRGSSESRPPAGSARR